MASVESAEVGGKKGPGVKKAKKMSTNIDMTPMVDLAFLLITFFIFSTTMSQPTAMDLVVPKDEKDEKQQTQVDKRGVLNILLDEDKVFTYEGSDPLSMEPVSYADVRKKILDKKKQTETYNMKDKFMVIIKPSKDATFQHTVDMLDEMTINDVKRYALVDIGEQEYELMNK